MILTKKISLQIKQYKRLLAFWKSLVEWFGWDGCWEMDGAEFEQLAEEHGLIRWENYDPEIHGEMDIDEGEKIWFSAVEG